MLCCVIDLLPRPRFIFVLERVGRDAAKLTMDAVRQSKAGEEGVQRFLVAQVLLGIDEPQQELLLLAGERFVQRVVGCLRFTLEHY